MTTDTIPLEAGIESRAISMTKGCYVGQEVIVRILHRGHGRVVRRLVGLIIGSGDPPAAGTAIYAASQVVGSVTSATWSPALGRSIALGYVHRDSAEAGTDVRIGSADGAEAHVQHLPSCDPTSGAQGVSRFSCSMRAASAGGKSSGSRASRATHRMS